MIKKLFSAFLLMQVAAITFSQSGKSEYPEPEFTKEIYFLNKGTIVTTMRLEKATAKMETKTKMGGFGGAESGYSWDGPNSAMRLQAQTNMSFVFSTGSAGSNSQRDSIMKANGMDPVMMQNAMSSMMDPANTIRLYKAETEKGKRKISMMKSPGAMPFGSKKTQSSAKYTFSVKKVREGYWELVIDKPLTKGEYAFTSMGMGMTDASGSITLFAFGVD